MDLKKLIISQDLPEQILSGERANILAYITYHPCSNNEIAAILDRADDEEISLLISTHFIDPIFHSFIIERGHHEEIEALIKKQKNLSSEAICKLFERNVADEISMFWKYRPAWRDCKVPLALLVEQEDIADIILECSLRNLDNDDFQAVIDCVQSKKHVTEKLLLRLLQDLSQKN